MPPAFALARWFTPARDISGCGMDEFLREELLGDLYGDRVVAHKDEELLVLTARQTVQIRHLETRGAKLVMFDSVANDKWEHVSFWFNLSSVADLLKALEMEARPEADAFDTLFLGVKPG